MIAKSTNQPAPLAGRILLCAERPAPLYELVTVAGDAPLEVELAESPVLAIEKLAQRPFDVCVVDADWTDAVVADLLARVRVSHGSTQMIRLTERPVGSSPGDLHEPGVEIVTAPTSPEQVRRLVRSGVQMAKLHAENRSLKRRLQSHVLNEIIGQSDAAQQLREAIREAADHEGSMLISGEPGTGSQHVAQVVHMASRRATRPFLVLDCRVHSADSLEGELFGESEPTSVSEVDGGGGRLASCAGGALLLKNVETLPVAIQRKLAGILARGAYPSPAADQSRPFDVRILASTHVDLADEAQQGRFNVQLYGQLTGRVVSIPPLRERRPDIGLITEYVLNRLAVVEGKPVKRLSVKALRMLRAHDWPGNQRELENVVERACSLDEDRLVTAEMLNPWISLPIEEIRQESPSLSLREMERKLIETTFARCQGNREHTARLLKIGIRTLSGKLREYGYPPRGGPGSNRRLSRAA